MTDMKPLTRQIYDFIVGFINTEGFSPTLREVGDGCHLAHSSLYTHLGVLEGKDWIVREYGIPRSIRLGQHAPDYVAPDDKEASV